MANGIEPALLEQSELFGGLGMDGLLASATSASRVSLRTGAQLLKQGDPRK